MAEDLGDRTEMPTAKRKSDARGKGQVGKSTDLSAAILLTAAAVVLWVFGSKVLSTMGALIAWSLSPAVLSHDVAGQRIKDDIALAFGQAAGVTFPIMLLLAVAAYISGLVQVGFLLSSKILKPNFSKFNLVSGIKKLLGRKSWVKGAMDLAKFSAVAGVIALVFIKDLPMLRALAALDIVAGIGVAGQLALELIIWVLAVLVLLGIIDIWYQKWQHIQDLKMTKHEVKDERRAAEGDTDTKARRLRMARQVAMQRIGQAVPTADVVVTNPTHFSVAIKYDAATMNAPKVIAKGADYLALKIRYIAAANGVPIVERPPLARALYQNAGIGQEVSPEHYEAVAEVLAYVYRLENRLAAS